LDRLANRLLYQATNLLDKITVAHLIDHALLAPDLTDQQLHSGLTLARQAGCCTACVHAADAATASRVLAGSKTGVCAVVGFPLGRQSTRLKTLEAAEAFQNGATELDMVLHLGYLKSGRFQALQEDIQAVAEATPAPLKVILETGYLTAAEITAACQTAIAAGAKFVKTSTGFGPGGAAVADIKLMRKTVGENCGVKAAGGIATLKDLLQMVQAGANRIGTSKTAMILKELQF
jgi:deoxyribose-phosphate aldolase